MKVVLNEKCSGRIVEWARTLSSFGLLAATSVPTCHDGALQIVTYMQFMAKLKEYDLGLKRLVKIEKAFRKKMLDDATEYAAVQECIAMLRMIEGRILEGFSHYKQTLAICGQKYADNPEMIDAMKTEIQKNCEQIGYYLGERLNSTIQSIYVQFSLKRTNGCRTFSKM